MNREFNQIPVEEILFFDTEVARSQKTLDMASKEFELYQKKTRDRKTDELLSDEEVIQHYNTFAGLKMCYNQTIVASIGVIKKGVVYIKSFSGKEQDVIKGLYEQMGKYKYVAGFNIKNYDLPVTRSNSLRHKGLSELLPEPFNDSGKRPWNLPKVIDLMDIFSGTFWANPSLDEVCFHLNIKSPKGDIDGGQISEVYYSEGVERISEYCNQDVFATINLFNKLRGLEIIDTFVDADKNKEPETKLSKLKQIMVTGVINKETAKAIRALKLTKKEKPLALEIIKAVYGEKKKNPLPKEITKLLT